MKPSGIRPHRTERMNLRVAPQEKRLIRTAAKEEGMSSNEFMVSSARDRAEEVLEQKREFRLPPGQWKAFVEALDRPVQIKPRLRRLFSEPTSLDRR